LVQIGGYWYRVAYSYDGDDTTLPLALQDDSSVITHYYGKEMSSGSIYRWARGFEWSVTFISTDSEDIQLLSSPKHGLTPVDASVSIRTIDCVNCITIPNLVAWQTYGIKVRAHNSIGFGDYAYATGIPKEQPGAPSLSVDGISGDEIEVLFYPPSGSIQDISQYYVQWDADINFTNATSADSSCGTAGYGSCVIFGDALLVTLPYSYIIQDLIEGEKYYVRVSAVNSITLNAYDADGSTLT